MVGPPPNSETASNLLSTQSALIQTLCSFLTVSTHHILFLRSIYPRTSFVSTRAYNFPARQNRHPGVCAWVNDAVEAIRDQLEKNTVEKVALCIFEVDKNMTLEKWMFDLTMFPAVGKADHDTPFDKEPTESDEVSDSGPGDQINVADLEAHFRGILTRLDSICSRLQPLPRNKECSFTLAIEVRDHADRPVGRLEREERKWIPAEPGSFHGPDAYKDVTEAETKSQRRSSRTKGNRLLPVRRLEAGKLRIEVTVEELEEKLLIQERESAVPKD